MAAPRVCVLRAPGTNCDVETAFAFETTGAIAERVHLFRLLENPQRLAEFQILCIPGGFSYGDDVGAGVIFSQQLRGRLAEAVAEFLQKDTLVLGICNGFQVLLKAGILPGGPGAWMPGNRSNREATLTWNDNGKYTALWVHLRVDSSHNVFLKGIDEIELPVAHAEGKIVARDESVISAWRKNGQIAACYCRPEGNGAPIAADDSESKSSRLDYPYNPNGSDGNIAGLSDLSGRVLGLMPHPERFIHATQHPQWTRRRLKGDGAGLQLFRNAVAYYE